MHAGVVAPAKCTDVPEAFVALLAGRALARALGEVKAGSFAVPNGFAWPQRDRHDTGTTGVLALALALGFTLAFDRPCIDWSRVVVDIKLLQDLCQSGATDFSSQAASTFCPAVLPFLLDFFAFSPEGTAGARLTAVPPSLEAGLLSPETDLGAMHWKRAWWSRILGMTQAIGYPQLSGRIPSRHVFAISRWMY